MKAILYNQFGSVDVLRTGDIEAPQPQPRGVVVQVRAASLNVIDSRSRRGEMSPFVNKKFPKIPGVDFSGVISAVGDQVSDLKPGDEVLGATDPFKGRALAEYVAVPRDAIARKPASLPWEEAAALPLAGVAALLSLRNLGRVQSGQRVLVHGSSGGLGSLAVQLARLMGARVTTVSGTSGVGLSRELGAHECVDYQRGGAPSGTFDLALNFSGHFPFQLARPFLAENGRFVEPSPTIPKFISSMIANLFRRQKHLMLTAQVKTPDLETLLAQVTEGHLRVVVGKVFPFRQAQDAFLFFEKGSVLSKVVVNSFS